MGNFTQSVRLHSDPGLGQPSPHEKEHLPPLPSSECWGGAAGARWGRRTQAPRPGGFETPGMWCLTVLGAAGLKSWCLRAVPASDL